MNVEMGSVPFRITLLGYRGLIKDGIVHTSAKPLMDKMWKEIQVRQLKATGINYWVYLPNSIIFTGVELKESDGDVGTLELFDVSLDRYVTYRHVGPYSTLGAIWPKLMEAVKQLGEKPQYPNLEIYGHWNADETKCETTIMIGLAK